MGEERLPLVDSRLARIGIRHGFGQRGSGAPPATCFPRQVHGTALLTVAGNGAGPSAPEAAPPADVVVTGEPGRAVGIVTADCVPILGAAVDGSATVAIHGGWRGLAAGVVEVGIDALRRLAPGVELVFAVGPGARGCCYEVDAPVVEALRGRYPDELEPVLTPGRLARFQLDLSALAIGILARGGADPARIGRDHQDCTICDPHRFESYRREGSSSGRLRHFIVRPEEPSREG